MPVDISKIPERARKITSPLTPVTDEYDSLWGFYTFSQTVQYDYDDIGKTGLSYAVITINGFFTINAEVLDEDELRNMTDSEKSDKLFLKYKALRSALLDKIGKKQPSKLSYIGTINDDRCIKLPNKLMDNMSGYIYAIPNAFATTEISPEILKYTVTLTEPKKVPCKLAIESDIIDSASLSIVCRRPRVTYRNFAFANGSEAYITGIDNRRYSLSGSICGLGDNIKYKDFVHIYSSNSSSDDSTSASTDNSTSASTGMSVYAVNVISKIINKDKGRVCIKIQKTSDDEPENAFAMIVTGHNIGYGLDNGVMNIDISGEECSNSGSGSGSGSGGL